MTDPTTRHKRGLIVVITLALVFFALLAALILSSNGEDVPQPVTAAEELTVLPVRIRIRTEPQARAPVVATATSGEQLKLLEDRGAWVRVETRDGLSGWAERVNLERTIEGQRRQARYAAIRNLPPLDGEVTERAPLYAGPGIFYPLVGELAEGNEVKVYTRDHDFYAIEHGKQIAYASVDAIDVTAAGAQLDVRTSSLEPPATQTSATAAPPQTASTDTRTTEPEPMPEPEPIRVPEPVERATGVYTSVPPGGTQPREIDRPVPRYPAAARRAGVQGPVVVRGIVRRDGTIDNVEILKDLPFGLGEEARRAVSRWRFRPATVRGEPIDVYYTVTVNFRLQ
ncbi:MAG TPA: TonB family protein [Thermoanaerobaculia bacterium]|nr:TonB family protein [Thermoanaerobaculia bacterium]